MTSREAVGVDWNVIGHARTLKYVHPSSPAIRTNFARSLLTQRESTPEKSPLYRGCSVNANTSCPLKNTTTLIPSLPPIDVFVSESHLKPRTFSVSTLLVYGVSMQARSHPDGPTTERSITFTVLRPNWSAIAALIDESPFEHAESNAAATLIRIHFMTYNVELTGRQQATRSDGCCRSG
jgi:hypothetical protein